MDQVTATPSLSFSEALSASTNKIMQFTGRSRRSEYWWTILLVFIINSVVLPIFFCIPIIGTLTAPLIGFLLDLATIPLTFRRLHDTGRSGWWCGIGVIIPFLFIICFVYEIIVMSMYDQSHNTYPQSYTVATFIVKYILLALVCFIYRIVLLVFACIDSEQYENDYGPSPKYVMKEDV